MFIARKSIATNKVRTLDIPCTPEQLARYEQGESVEKAFPRLNLFHREFIISGMTRSEWLEVFSEQDNGFGKEPGTEKAPVGV
jgi:hypothetical protein